jgi:hypothetical protein
VIADPEALQTLNLDRLASVLTGVVLLAMQCSRA